LAEEKKSETESKAKDWRRLLRPVLLVTGLSFLILLLALPAFYLAVSAGLFGPVPTEQELKSKQNSLASELYSSDGVLLGRYFTQDRTNVSFHQISPAVIKALLATEDVRFYEHKGVDTRSLMRVLFKTLLLQNESSGGGSTLSQQLAKNLYPRKDNGRLHAPVNKVREFIVARRLESIYNKEEILELYLNTVPMGGNIYGIDRASRRFFDTSAESLKTEEAAVLVGMLKATTTYNPRLDAERSRQRRNVVLSQMAKYGFLASSEADSLQQLPLTLRYRYETHNDGLAPYFREQLRLELVAWCATQKKPDGQPYNLYTDGLKIYSTLHSSMQAHAEEAVRKKMAGLQKQFDEHWKGQAPWGRDTSVVQTALRRSDRYLKLKRAGKTEAEIAAIFREPVPMDLFSWRGTTRKEMSPLDSVKYYQRFLNVGLLAMEPGTGFVRAWVGGIDHHGFKYDHVRSRRQVGSTFKPIVYAAALDYGLDPCAFFPNERQTYPTHDNWEPRNANDQYGGEYSMRGALAHSVNTVSAQVLMQTGVDRTVQLAQRLGIETELPAVPSLALGTASLSLLEMVGAYASLATEGNRTKPVYITKITDRTGKVIREHKPGERKQRALSADHSALMVQLMQGVVEEGSAARLRSEYKLTMDIAGKTGTTQDHADGWFIGITPDLVTGVWVGAESPAVRFRTLQLGQGANTALPVWGDFMGRVVQDKEFAPYRTGRFRPLRPELQARLDCLSFQEIQPEEEEEPKLTIIEKLFGDIAKKSAERSAQKKKIWEIHRERSREFPKAAKEKKREAPKEERGLRRIFGRGKD
jgi:penicillin-binding protein 1A